MSRMTLTAITLSLAVATTASTRADWPCNDGDRPLGLVGWGDPLSPQPITVIRGQSPVRQGVSWSEAGVLINPAAHRETDAQLGETMYSDLVAELEMTKAELRRLRQNMASAGIEDHTNHFSFAGYNMNNTYLQPQGGAGGAAGGNGGGMGGDSGGGMGDVATQSQNPVGGLWMMWLQNDMKLLEGPLGGKRIFNTTVFQPVMPVQLNDTWKLINRPVFMFNAFETPGNFEFRPGGGQDPVFPPDDPFSTQAGLGDIALIQWLSKTPADSKLTFGAGWNWMFPASTKQEDLGTGRTSLGPSVVSVYLGDKIITGAIVQQYWSIDSRADRDRVSLMDVQYIFRYRLNPMFSVGFAPNMQWDQVTDRVTMPVGIGFDTMTMTKSKMPIRWGAELQYFASHESGDRMFDPEWNFRLYVSPIIKAPDWATRGLFGGGRCGCNCCGRRQCCCH